MTSDAALSFNPVHLIGCCLHISIVPAAKYVFPDENRIATQILARSIGQALQLRDVLRSVCGSFGPLNDCGVVWDVNDRKIGLQIVCDELQSYGILKSAQVGWYCMDEGVWRGSYPSSESTLFAWRFRQSYLADDVEELKLLKEWIRTQEAARKQNS
jgi:hypothetical protein